MGNDLTGSLRAVNLEGRILRIRSVRPCSFFPPSVCKPSIETVCAPHKKSHVEMAKIRDLKAPFVVPSSVTAQGMKL